MIVLPPAATAVEELWSNRMDDMPKLMTRLQDLRCDYIDSLRQKQDNIEGGWGLLERGQMDGNRHEQVKDLLHELAGTGVAFGFPAISRICRDLELCCQDILPGNPIDPEQQERFKKLLADLKAAVAAPVAWESDIDNHSQVEEALKRASDFNEAILNAMFDAMAIIDVHDFSIQRVNQVFLDYLGMEEQEVLGRPCYEVTHKRTSPCREPHDPCPLFTTLETGHTHVFEHVHYKKDGSPTYHEVGTAPIRDANGAIVQVLHVARDISERKKLEEQLLQAQKMEAIGRLSGGVAHDFNNLLTAIIGYSELALGELPGDAPLREHFDIIYSAGSKAAALTRQLLAFSRKQLLEVKVVNLNTIVENSAKLLRSMIGEDLELIIHTRSSLDNMMADAAQIEQILMNLVVNAKDAMPQGGTLTIETAVQELDESYAAVHAGIVPGRYVQLTVSDTGCGMTPEVQEQIFEPFFTTKASGEGTGLGLSTVYGIVKQHKGNIYVYSEPGKGTIFKVYLPTVRNTVLEAVSPPERPPLPKGTESILVVDDDSGIRHLVAATLRPLGYSVLEAGSGEEALQIAAAETGTIDLLLTDVVMPGINGRALAERLAPSRPEMRMVYMSGYTDNVIADKGILLPGIHFINKPLVPTALARRLRAILDGNA
jgi:two-component system cell cycle sensor histidine kinase/response regulator CckA